MWQARRTLLEGTLLLKLLNFEFLVINNRSSEEKFVPYRLQRKLSLSAECFSQKEKKLKVSEMPSPMKVVNPTDGGVAMAGSPLKRKLWGDAASKENQNVRDVKPKLMFAKLTDKAHAPTKGSEVAAGYDLKSAYDYVVPKRGHILVKTDIQIKVPDGTYGRVAPRSGLALKNKIDVGAGVIDQDYRGNVGVILFNHGDDDFHISAGDRVAQLICEKIEYPEATEVESLDQTERGEGGFGSTGVKSQ